MTRASGRIGLGRIGLGALALSAVLGLSACQQTTQASAAAVVGGASISTSTLRGLLDRALANDQARTQFAASSAAEQQFQQSALARLINRRLLDDAAGRAGVAVSPAQVDDRYQQLVAQVGGVAQLRQQAAQAGIAAPDLHAFVRDLVVGEALGTALTKDVPVDQQQLRALYASSRGQFERAHVEAIVVGDKALADQIVAQVNTDPSKFAALARQYSTDATKSQGGDLGTISYGQLTDALNAVVFAAPTGATVEVPNGAAFTIVHVLSRQTTPYEQAVPQLRQAALKDQITAALNAALTRSGKRLGVHVNPRFGRYDLAQHVVVPVDKAVLAPAPASSSPARLPGRPTGR